MRKAGVMIIIRDGLMLGISRRNDPSKYGFLGGKYDFIAGDRDTNDTAIREAKEEAGIQVISTEHIFTRVEPKESPTGEDFFVYCYYATAWKGEPRDSEEGHVKWLTQAELTSPEIGAFADYNARTLEAFKALFPNVPLI
jgi:8-oxo-dGTP pyrophosphatase MutT (NUDIX family)